MPEPERNTPEQLRMLEPVLAAVEQARRRFSRKADKAGIPIEDQIAMLVGLHLDFAGQLMGFLEAFEDFAPDSDVDRATRVMMIVDDARRRGKFKTLGVN